MKVGLQKLSHTRSLHKDIKLQVDKQDVELPSIEGLIFLNIPRYRTQTLTLTLTLTQTQTLTLTLTLTQTHIHTNTHTSVF